MNAGDDRVRNIRASILFLDLVSGFISGFSANDGLALSAFGDIVVKHVLVGSRLAFRNFQDRFIKGFARKVITSMSSFTDVFFERKVVSSSSVIVPVGFQALGNIIWIKVVVFNLRKYSLIDWNFVKPNDDSRSILLELVP